MSSSSSPVVIAINLSIFHTRRPAVRADFWGEADVGVWDVAARGGGAEARALETRRLRARREKGERVLAPGRVHLGEIFP